MEITLLTHLFYFDVILLSLIVFKEAYEKILLNVFCALGFITYGLCLFADVVHVAPFSVAAYYYKMDANLVDFQYAVGFFFVLFGFGLLVVFIIKYLEASSGMVGKKLVNYEEVKLNKAEV